MTEQAIEVPALSGEVTPPIVAPPGGSLITTPSGYRIAVRNPNVLRVKDRRKIMAGLDTENPGESYIDMLNRVAAALILDWDLRAIDDAGEPHGPVLPLPSLSLDVLEDVPLAEVGELDRVVRQAMALVMPDFSPSPDEKSPTRPSAG